MQRTLGLVAALASVAFLVGSARLGQLERAGPPHADLVLDGGVPATVYLPGPERDAFMDPPPREDRPPALVLAHGIAGDRRSLSGLARRIAASGTAVLVLDLSGHGENRNPYAGSNARGDAFYPDLRAAVDFLRSWPFVDGSRVAVGGHSMGAGASLDYATRDSGIDATVLIAGGWRLAGPYRPANALFLYAEGDREAKRARGRSLARALTELDALELGRTYGRPDRLDAVRLVEIAGANHASIVDSDATVAEIVAWLDASFGRPVRSAPPPGDPRAGLLLPLTLALLLLLPGLGLVVGRLVPTGPERPAEGRLLGLALLAAALLLVLPLLSIGSPGEILPFEIGDVVVGHFFLAGLGLLVALRLRWPEHLAGVAPQPLSSLAGALPAVVAIFALLQPFAAVLHGLALTPERCALFVFTALGLLPLTLAGSALLRRGSTAAASLGALGGRLLVLVVLIAGVRLGVLHPGAILLVGSLAIMSVFLEVFASALYAASRNLLAIAVVDAAWLALVMAAILPVKI